jgi:hypothetical protein
MPRGEVLYSRINPEIKDTLTILAERFDMPVTLVVDIVLARGLGKGSIDRGEALRKYLDAEDSQETGR